MKTFTKYNIYHFYTGITLLCILQGCTEDKIVYKSIKDLSEEPAYLEIEKFKDTLITTKILFEGNVDEFNTVDSNTLLEAERYVMVYVLSY